MTADAATRSVLARSPYHSPCAAQATARRIAAPAASGARAPRAAQPSASAAPTGTPISAIQVRTSAVPGASAMPPTTATIETGSTRAQAEPR